MSTAAGHNAAINLDLKWLVIRREVAPDVGLLCKAIADSPGDGRDHWGCSGVPYCFRYSGEAMVTPRMSL